MGLASFNRMRRLQAEQIAAEQSPVDIPIAEMSLKELRAAAKVKNIPDYGKMGKEQLIDALSGLEA